MAPLPSLFDPDVYVKGPPHERFAEMRRSEPASWQEVPDQEGCWAVLRHGDLVQVARETGLFSARLGGVVLDDITGDVTTLS